MATILIISNNAYLAALVKKTMLYEGHDVEIAYDLISGKDLCVKSTPDLIVTDWETFQICAFDYIKKVSSAPVIVMMENPRYAITEEVVWCLNDGADDVVEFPFHPAELAARSRALLRRHANKKTLQVGDLNLSWKGQLHYTDRTIILTAREFDLLKVFMLHPGQALSKELLSTSVWGDTYGMDSKQLDIYIGRLRSKIGSDKIKSIRDYGWMLENK